MVFSRSISYIPNKYPELSSSVFSSLALALLLNGIRFFHFVNLFQFRHGTLIKGRVLNIQDIKNQIKVKIAINKNWANG